MKKLYFAFLMAGASLMANAQATFDVLKLSETELSGTSRYMSMAGAFGALGGDASAQTINPGGIGVYRKSDISATMNLNFLSTKCGSDNLTDTKFWFNNVAYVGSMKIDSDFFKYFNWGFSFNRVKSFNRRYQGGYDISNYSLTNKIADNLNAAGWINDDLSVVNNSNPYYDTNAPWLGILAYQSYLLNENSDGSLRGLAMDGTNGTANFYVEEKGHTDEYNITLGGNFKNTVFWGLNFGITDLRFDSYQYYGEDLNNAEVTDYVVDEKGDFYTTGSTTSGYAGYDFQTYLETRGTGYNFKMGLIVKPINQLRIGAAFHTPTYYDMKDFNKVQSGFDLLPDGQSKKFQGNTETGENGYYDDYRYTIKTPWRFIGSLAIVPSSKGMISFDYEYVGANTMRCGEKGYNYADTEYKIKEQLQPSHIMRVGAEFRATPNFSIRAGYSYQTSPVKDGVKGVANDNVDVVSSNYMYQYDKNNQYITCGLGYRYKSFYVDAAYVHQTRTSHYHAYPGEIGEEVKDNNNKAALTLGFRF